MIGGGNSRADNDGMIDENLSTQIKEMTNSAIQETNKIKEALVKQMSSLENKMLDKANKNELAALDDHLSRSLD